jgi:hypothetical protein
VNTIIQQALSSVDVGSPLVHRNLAAFPLFGPSVSDPGYLTLDEALARGVIVISELTQAGSVPELKVVNQGDLAVLLVDGEELVGAKQNRVLNLTVLVPAGTTTVIPVSCVEAGRWAWRGEQFAASTRAHYARGRARKVEQVTDSLRHTGEALSDQGAVWDDISLKAAALGAPSATGAMADIYEHHGATVEEFVKALAAPLAPGQSGVAFALDGQLAGVDLFDAPSTCERLLPKLVRSYALDAIESRTKPNTNGSPPEADPVRAFLGELAGAEAQAFPAVGEGEAVRLSARVVAGAALVARDRVVHVEGFARVGVQASSTTGRIRRRVR